ncbi:hypothetical protein KCH_58180 [Kitasatospora cheerisanensis KCTC 2395]|uniref:Uncharacterized protein n=1 Tax=Kitasatospora cheerisanensis KCTC 2395 TaxID=1348663 RepID=A0A066YW37_9ACTN|nr:hypothetical protein KCH_58180 [Kitasatospora cheerisanensis KCTC 2395]
MLLGERVQTGDHLAMDGPVGGGELGGGSDGLIGDQRENRALNIGAEPAPVTGLPVEALLARWAPGQAAKR